MASQVKVYYRYEDFPKRKIDDALQRLKMKRLATAAAVARFTVVASVYINTNKELIRAMSDKCLVGPWPMCNPKHEALENNSSLFFSKLSKGTSVIHQASNTMSGILEITSFSGSFVQDSPLGLVHACAAILRGNMDDELLAAWARLPAEDKFSELKMDSKWGRRNSTPRLSILF